MGTSQQPVTQQTTQTRDPWVAAQGPLSLIIGQAGNLFNANAGYQPYTGQTQAPLDPWAAQGLGSQAAIAAGSINAPPGVPQAQALGTNLIQNQGLTPGLQAALGQYGSLYNEASGQQNPYLQAILETSNRRIGDRINAAMSGAGRYGSGAHTDVMARALAEAANPILAQDYLARQAQRMQATGAQADVYGQALQRAGQWSQLMPSLFEAQLAPAQALAAAGQYQQNRAQAELADQIKMYNAQQARDWEQLARWNAIVGGAGGLGGTQVTATPGPQQPSLLQSGLGGALAGGGIGSIFGPAGAGVGALGGGLLGLLR